MLFRSCVSTRVLPEPAPATTEIYTMVDTLSLHDALPILVVVYRAQIESGELRVAPDEASEARFFPRAELPALEELAWPSTAHGLDAWRAYEPPRP